MIADIAIVLSPIVPPARILKTKNARPIAAQHDPIH